MFISNDFSIASENKAKLSKRLNISKDNSSLRLSMIGVK